MVFGGAGGIFGLLLSSLRFSILLMDLVFGTSLMSCCSGIYPLIFVRDGSTESASSTSTICTDSVSCLFYFFRFL